MTDTIDTNRSGGDIEARLVMTLRVKADQLPAEAADATTPFLPGPMTSIRSLDDPPSAPPRRVPRAAWVAVAAAVVLLALLAASMWLRSDDESRTVTVPPGALGSAGRPTWVPDGYQVVDARSLPDPTPAPRPTESEQAFGDDDRPEVLIEVGGSMLSQPQQATSPTATVRGATARAWTPSTGQAQPQDTVTADYSWAATQLTWEEGGTTVRATFRQTGLDDAVRLLDAAVWRTGSPFDGFDPAGFAPSPLLAETLSVRPEGGFTTLRYSSDPATQQPPADLAMTIFAAPGPVDAYYRLWATEGRAADGSVLTGSDGSGTYPDRSDPSGDGLRTVPMHEVQLRWPDGSGALLQSPTLERDDLERVARSIEPTTPDDIDAMQVAASTQLVGFPTVASTVLPSGTLSLHEVGATDAICLVPASGPPRCRLSAGLQEGDRNAVTGDAVVDGQWFVFGVGRSAPVVYSSYADRGSGNPAVARDPSTPPSTTSLMATLPIETGTDGSHRFLLVPVPAGRDTLVIEVPGASGGVSDLLQRPAS